MKIDGVFGDDDEDDVDDDDVFVGWYVLDECESVLEEGYVADEDEVVIKVKADADSMDVGNFGMLVIMVVVLRK